MIIINFSLIYEIWLSAMTHIDSHADYIKLHEIWPKPPRHALTTWNSEFLPQAVRKKYSTMNHHLLVLIFPWVINLLLGFLFLQIRFSLQVSVIFSFMFTFSNSWSISVFVFPYSRCSSGFPPLGDSDVLVSFIQCSRNSSTKELSSFAEATHDSWPSPVSQHPLHSSLYRTKVCSFHQWQLFLCDFSDKKDFRSCFFISVKTLRFVQSLHCRNFRVITLVTKGM